MRREDERSEMKALTSREAAEGNKCRQWRTRRRYVKLNKNRKMIRGRERMSGDKRSQRRVTMCDEKIESMIKIMSRKCDMLGEIEGGKDGKEMNGR